jgi:Zinc carboxypeptidase
MRRFLVAGAVIALSVTLIAPVAVRRPTSQAEAKRTLSPVALTDAEYELYGRVFPDPHGCRDGAPDSSPYAKGNVCAADFIQYEEMTAGLKYMQQLFPRFVQFFKLNRDFNCSGKPVANSANGCKAFKSAGLPVTVDENGRGFVRERRPLYMLRITDENVPNNGKKYFVFPLSIHGIERAGVEGGTRAAEDLATWGACGAGTAPEIVDCESDENKAPHPLLEATPDKSITADDALQNSVTFFVYSNPDGWLRGDRFRDRVPNTRFYQRYNGNGVDLNRDWPEQGYTFRPYTPWSEPENKAFGRVLQAIGPKTEAGKPKWTGGIDLHGQLIDRAFSFTLLGGSQRDYAENQRILQTVKGAWRDAEQRLAWSPAIKPNDAPPDDPRVYGVQWGTIWDTLDYTVTGALGDWIDSPLGLNADGIDNEMSISHLINCGVGTCYIADAEQLHVDGNKSLIYSMINYSFKREGNVFNTEGRVGYVLHRGVVSSPTRRESRPPRFAQLPPQADIRNEMLTPENDFTFNFRVKGPSQGVYNGGIAAELTCASEVSPCAFSEARLERKNPKEKDPAQGDSDWEIVNSYFNQAPTYVQGGQALHGNLPIPGRYRVRIVDGEVGVAYKLDIDFTREKGWPDPGQIGYRVTNMRAWQHLERHARPGLEPVSPEEIADASGWKQRYDTLVVTNKVYADLADELRRWVSGSNGNLVLTDRALKMLPHMGIVDRGVRMRKFYAGYVNFATQSDDETYDDPLARDIDQPGAAEGQTCGLTDPDPCTDDDEVHRHQTYEPVPLGFAIQKPDGSDAFKSPVWFVTAGQWDDAQGEQRAVGTTGSKSNVSYGEIELGGGRIRIIGAALPMPSDDFDHPFGLANYALTYSGFQVLENALTWTR